MRHENTYPSNVDMVFLAILYNVNIVSYSNYSTGIESIATAAFIDGHIQMYAINFKHILFTYHNPLTPNIGFV